jgi:hypothetical protein
MMRLYFLFVFLVCMFRAESQLMPYPPGTHVASPNLDKFVGTWQWISGTDTVKIVLAKQNIYMPAPMDNTIETLVGWHRYVKNGIEVESSLQYLNSTFNSGHHTLFGGDISPTKIYFTTFKDITKNKQCNLYFTLLTGSVTQATWKLFESRGLRKTGYTLGFTLPNNITLTKQ